MIIDLRNIKKLTISILIPLLVGALSGYITKNSMELYSDLIKPSFAPPGEIFGIVWPILYVLMGIASYRVWKYGYNRNEVKSALTFYAIQLILNFMWPIIYFNLGLRGVALILIILLLLFVIITTIKFYKIDKVAGYLMIPYVAWLMFATILNYYTWVLNK
ncbi:TspO/MBR family protein [Tepidibacter aestuarii]|uniref:TspO/MBR family protein n=1 Tax=Tepidibacter aestuarii TaxID=2925782 RepID=UPI0020C042FC|nr:TspO/MBR family protein [Tepidibacter aestuarii]CAH2214123.1 translocator protein [Tepidibacter aestuarii]